MYWWINIILNTLTFKPTLNTAFVAFPPKSMSEIEAAYQQILQLPSSRLKEEVNGGDSVSYISSVYLDH